MFTQSQINTLLAKCAITSAADLEDPETLRQALLIMTALYIDAEVRLAACLLRSPEPPSGPVGD